MTDHKFVDEIKKLISLKVGRYHSTFTYTSEDMIDLAAETAEKAIEYFRTIHSRALACHCECLGMNAENAMACCGNYTPPYSDKHYYECMQKWELINEEGKPII